MNDVLTLAVFAAQSAVPHRVRIRPETGWQHRRRQDADESRRLR